MTPQLLWLEIREAGRVLNNRARRIFEGTDLFICRKKAHLLYNHIFHQEFGKNVK